MSSSVQKKQKTETKTEMEQLTQLKKENKYLKIGLFVVSAIVIIYILLTFSGTFYPTGVF
jgi:hypothetical protein